MPNSPRDFDLKLYSYHGVTLPDPDPKNQGRYKVHILELMPLIKSDKGIWCKNQVHKYRWTPSDDYMYGSYMPIQPGTKVLVKFYDDDFHSGYIERIISDQIIETTPKLGCKLNPEATTDRDDVYLLLKTPKKHNLFVIFEETKDDKNKLNANLIPNSIHFYYNYRRSTFIVNEDGIHVFTMDNRGVTVEGDNNEWVNKSEKIYVKKTRDVYVDGESQKHYVEGNDDYISKQMMRFASEVQESHITKIFSCDCEQFLINCGNSISPDKAKPNKGEDEIVKQNKIDMRISGHQKKEEKPDTYMGFTKYEVNGGVPTPGHPDKQNVKLEKGLNDRHSEVGAQQAEVGKTPVPSYPTSGNDSLPSMGSGLDDITRSNNIMDKLPGGSESILAGAAGGFDKIKDSLNTLSEKAKYGLSTVTQIPVDIANKGKELITKPIIDKVSEFNQKLSDTITNNGKGLDFDLNKVTSGQLSADFINEYMGDFANSFNSVGKFLDNSVTNTLDTIKTITNGNMLNDMVNNTINATGVVQLYNELIKTGNTLYNGVNSWINPFGMNC